VPVAAAVAVVVAVAAAAARGWVFVAAAGVGAVLRDAYTDQSVSRPRNLTHCAYYLHFEPFLEAFSLRPDVIGSTKILSLA
jgi:hypothetical protein